MNATLPEGATGIDNIGIHNSIVISCLYNNITTDSISNRTENSTTSGMSLYKLL